MNNVDAPSQFGINNWSVADDGTSGDITITISSLPSDGGSTITDLEYQLDGGSWVSLSGTTTGDYAVSGLTDDQEYDVAIRAVNAEGNGTASVTKAVTPTAPSQAPAVADQTLNFGRLTLASAGGAAPITTQGAISSASIDSGTDADHWQIASDGTITPSATGVSEGLSASYTLGCTFSNDAGSDSATITINTEADTYSFKSSAELDAILDIGMATVSGKTMKGRSVSDDWVNSTLNSRAFTSLTTITSHDTENPFTFEFAGARELRAPTNLALTHLRFISNFTIGSDIPGGGAIVLKNNISNFQFKNNECDGGFSDLVSEHGAAFDSDWTFNGILGKDGTAAVTGAFLIEDNVIHDFRRGLSLPGATGAGYVNLVGNEFYNMTVDCVRYDGAKPSGGLIAWNIFRTPLHITPPEVAVLSVDTDNNRMTADSDRFGSVSDTVTINIGASTATPPGGTNYPGVGGANDYACTIVSVSGGETVLQFPVDITSAGSDVYVEVEPAHADFVQAVPGAGATVDGVKVIGNIFFGDDNPEGAWPQSLFMEDIASSTVDGWYDNTIIALNMIWGGAPQGIWLYNSRDGIMAANTAVGPSDISSTSQLPSILMEDNWNAEGEHNLMLNNVARDVASVWPDDVLVGNTEVLPAGYAASGLFDGTGGYAPTSVAEFMTAFARTDLSGEVDYATRYYDLPEINETDAVSITDLTDQDAATLVTSAPVQVTGIVDSEGDPSSYGAYVSVYGGNSPEFRITSDEAGTSVVTDWTSTPAIIEEDEWLWVRDTTDAANEITTTTKVRVGAAFDEWSITTEAEAGDVTAPTIESLSPADDATDVAINANLVITFSETVVAGTGSIDLYDASDDSLVESFDVTSDVTIDGAEVTINPTSDLDNSASYYVQIDAGAFEDASSNAFAGIGDETTWNFSTVAAAASSPEVVDTTVAAVAIGTGTVNVSFTALENDIVAVLCGSDNVLTTSGIASGQGYNDLARPSSGTAAGVHLAWKRMGGTPDTQVTIQQDAVRGIGVIVAVVRGVDTTTAIDATIQTATGETGMPNPPSFTTATGGALRIIAGVLDDDSLSSGITAPSGFTGLLTDYDAGSHGAADVSVMMAFAEAESTGALDPDAFGGTGDDQWWAGHFALRPAA